MTTEAISEYPINVILLTEEPKKPETTSLFDYIPSRQQISDASDAVKTYAKFVENSEWVKLMSNLGAIISLPTLPSQIKNLVNLESMKSTEGVASLSEVALNVSKQSGLFLGKIYQVQLEVR